MHLVKVVFLFWGGFFQCELREVMYVKGLLTPYTAHG